MKFLIVFCVVSMAFFTQALTPSSFLSTVDKSRLKTVFESTFKKGTSDIPSLHYAILGYKLLGETAVPNSPDLCSKLTPKLDDDNVVTLYQAASAGKAAGCKIAPTDKAKNTIKGALEGATVSSVYHGVLASVSLGLPLDSAAISKALTAALKKDDSLTALGQAFHAASHLDAKSAAPFFDRVEDAIVQADEVDGKMLQFEGGLTITNLIIGGALKLGSKIGKPSAVNKVQAVKFANYFISRKSVQGVKGASQLLEGIMSLNPVVVPVITLASPATVSEASPKIRVRVSDLLGQPIKDAVTVVVDSAASKNDDGKNTYLKKSKMASVAGESSLFEIDMKSAKPRRGFYILTISANGKEIGNAVATLEVKVLVEVGISAAELGVSDSDQSIAPKLTSISHPNKLKAALDADHHQKVIFKFNLMDKDTNEAFKVHQAFIKLADKSGREIIFLAEKNEKAGNYKFELDVNSRASDFGNRNGIYSMELIVGDACISNPIVWTITELNLKFNDGSKDQSAKKSLKETEAKPEILHMFREPESRPPTVVSNAFTILCLCPIALMFILWAKLGVNLGDFPFSLTAIGFHLGLGSIFGLYYYFWVQLNMFTTMKYLMMIGIVTFLCGNSMLVKIAEKRKFN